MKTTADLPGLIDGFKIKNSLDQNRHLISIIVYGTKRNE